MISGTDGKYRHDVGQIRYCNYYGISESCRFGGSAERAKKKKVGTQKVAFHSDRCAFVRFCLYFNFRSPLLFSLFYFGFGSDTTGLIYIFLLLFTLCILAWPAFPTP